MIIANLIPVSGASGTGKSIKDQLALLNQFDTAFLINDSGSVNGKWWNDTRAALEAIVPICTEQDQDGVDIHFLNSKNGQNNVTTKEAVLKIFNSVEPNDNTPTGKRLREILEPYVASVEKSEEPVKPLNLIVITDGRSTDEEEENNLVQVIVEIAKRLDKRKASLTQLGIQFLQVGDDEDATNTLRKLDNDLKGKYEIRDMVDTEPFAKGGDFSHENVLKILLGSVDRRVDS